MLTNNTQRPQNPYGQAQQPVNPYLYHPGFNNFQRPTPTLPGRIVTDANEIAPQEVPMDGSVSLFLKNDYSCIYAKQWSGDGSIQTVRYVPEMPQTSAEPAMSVDDRFKQLNDRFDQLEKLILKRRPKYSQKPHDNHSEVTETSN